MGQGISYNASITSVAIATISCEPASGFCNRILITYPMRLSVVDTKAGTYSGGKTTITGGQMQSGVNLEAKTRYDCARRRTGGGLSFVGTLHRVFGRDSSVDGFFGKHFLDSSNAVPVHDNPITFVLGAEL